jgi:hypothetical protein
LVQGEKLKPKELGFLLGPRLLLPAASAKVFLSKIPAPLLTNPDYYYGKVVEET